jgi:CRISPR-associated protein Cmr2
MNQHLFLFTIGPVQSFIAQARKTQDLYAGSQILSKLTEAGIVAFGGDIIFPNKQNNSKPNRFLGKIENCQDLQKLGTQVENAVKDKFKELAEKAFNESGAKSKPNFFDKQICNHLEIFWIFEPIENDTNEAYKTAYKNIEQNLGAIKNVRTFNQMPETGRKCSLDGERNALFFGKNTNNKYWADEKWNKNSGAVELYEQDEAKVGKGEGLSAVSLLKRFYSNEGFPSTAKIALMQDEKAIDKKPEIKQCLASYKRIFSGQKEFLLECLRIKENIKFDNKKELIKQFDYQQLFEENIDEKNIPNPEQLVCAKKLYSSLKSYFKTKYYALLIFDGDNMGKWLSGVNLKSDNLEDFHEHLSEKLGNFAQNIDSYLQGYHFKTVYAGGDDYLGFVNLHSLFDVLQTLRQKFKEEVSDKLKEWKKDNKTITFDITQELTFSAGICIAHYKTPLDIVLRTAKAMEHKAKEEGGRDAFAISVLKHSGECHETCYSFKNDNLEKIQYITNGLLNEEFSRKFISVLGLEIRLLADDNNDFFRKKTRDNDIIGQSIAFSEIRRTIKRAKNLSTPDSKVEPFSNNVIGLFT